MSVRLNSVGGVLTVGLLVLLAGGCGSSDTPTASIPAPPPEVNSAAGVVSPGDLAPSEMAPEDLVAIGESIRQAVNLFPEVVIKTSAGDVRVRLNAELAPITVDNFLENYVNRGFYTDTIFHHVDQRMVITGGFTQDMEEKESRAPILNEARADGLKNKRGTIAMYRLGDYSDSATSQFFINLVDDENLDYDESSDNDGYCVFGEVIEGLEVLDSVSKVEVHESDGFPNLPVTPVVITAIELASGSQ